MFSRSIGKVHYLQWWAAAAAYLQRNRFVMPMFRSRFVGHLQSVSPWDQAIMRTLLIGAALVVGTLASPAFADWWIVRSSDGTCLVVDIEPTGKDKTLTKIGKDSYETSEQAEADVKQLCKEAAQPKPNSQDSR
jgi:hypothetical protein